MAIMEQGLNSVKNGQGCNCCIGAYPLETASCRDNFSGEQCTLHAVDNYHIVGHNMHMVGVFAISIVIYGLLEEK